MYFTSNQFGGASMIVEMIQQANELMELIRLVDHFPFRNAIDKFIAFINLEGQLRHVMG